jgi:hypothetical protein
LLAAAKFFYLLRGGALTMTWFGIITLLAILVILMMLSHLHLQFYFSRVNENDHFSVKAKVFGGLISYCLEVPYEQYKGICGGILVKLGFIKIPEKHSHHKKKKPFKLERITDMYHRAKRLLAHVVDIGGWLRHTLTYVKCTELRWETRLGIGDAAQTAMAVGTLWAVKSSLFGYIFQYVHLDAKPNVSIQPQYKNEAEFSMEFSCHTKIRIGLLFFSSLQLLWRIMKTENGLKTWQNTIFGRNRVQKA